MPRCRMSTGSRAAGANFVTVAAASMAPRRPPPAREEGPDHNKSKPSQKRPKASKWALQAVSTTSSGDQR